MIDLIWLACVFGLTALGLIYVRLLGSVDQEKQP